jgi:hypothetical protein
MKIGKNNFVVTFKTEDEVVEYMNRHIPEERRLLWLGFFIANNYIAQRLEEHQWPGFTWAIGDGSSNRDQATSDKLQAASAKLQA